MRTAHCCAGRNGGLSRHFITVCALILLNPTGLIAGDREEYAVTRIQPDLLRDEGAVYRLHEIDFQVMDDHRATERVTDVITVLKKEDRDEGELVVYYDRLADLTDLDGALYDSTGKEIRSLGKQDIQDYSAISSYTLYEDSRVRVAQLYHDQYPYTVEFTYEITFDGYVGWPTWYAQPSRHSVEESRFVVALPKKMTLRQWTNKDSLKCTQTTEGNRTTYRWTATLLPRIAEEFRRDDYEDLTTVIRIAPTRVTLEDISGDFSSWKSFGQWYGRLCERRDVLPESATQQVDSIVRNIENAKDRAATLYTYLQSRTRYVSINLGIGGWQPFDATYVHERGYGDCKALSNYMVSLLSRAGVVAYPVLIANGPAEPPLRTEFPSNQFNHAIVCVPLPADTVWLECTSQSMPFGRVGETNENRDALMVTPSGGVIVHIPASTSHQNFQRRVALVMLAGSGTADARITTVVGGDQEDRVRLALFEAPPMEREKWITNEVGIANMRLVNYSTDGLDTKEDVVSVSLQLLLPRYGSAPGERIFFNPNLMDRQTFVPPERSRKLSPVRFRYPFLDTDSIVYRIPQGYRCEALPSPTKLASSFGMFQSRATCVGDTTIVFTRALEITTSEIPPTLYPEYRSFFEGVVKADRSQVVLVQK